MPFPKSKGYKYWLTVSTKLEANERTRFLRKKGYSIRTKKSSFSGLPYRSKSYDLFYKKSRKRIRRKR